MQSESDIQATIEMLGNAIEARRLGENEDLLLEAWELAKSVLEWVVEADSPGSLSVDEWLIANAREELDIHPGGL